MSPYDASFRIMLLSDPEVDKSCMLPGFFQQDPDLSIGIDFWAQTFTIDKKKIKLQIWVLGGEERFRFLTHQYCIGANAAFFLYDITKSQTLNHMEDFLMIIRQNSGDIPIYLIGIIPNEKTKRKVSAKKGAKIAKEKKLNGFIEINAITRENVVEAYERITRLMLANEEYQTPIKMKKYEDFIVYDLENTGDRTKLNIGQEKLQYHLNPKKVLIIFHEDLRRIFIWKGLKSPVRKRFIASRVAQDLQRELMVDARYPRSKIVSIFQGEEPQEFLNAFGLKFLEKFPYPYDFKPPKPPDDFAIRSQFLEKVSNKGDMDRLLGGFQIPEEVKKEEQPRLSGEEIRILDLESVEGVKLIKQYQEETKRTALWKGKETNDFTEWLKGEKVEKLDQTVIDLISIYLEDIEIVLKSWETKYEMDKILHSLARFMLVYDRDYRLEFENFIERIKKWLDYDGNKYPYSEILKIVHGDDEYRQQFLPKRRRNFKDRERYPYPYVFKPPSPPDDLALAPREQFRSSSKKKDSEEEIHCQYCGIKLAKEEEITHSCKKKPE